MYYEARVHQIVEVASAADAAEKIKSCLIHSYQVAKWLSRDGQYFIYAVPDGHIDDMLLELAILRQPVGQENAPYQQVESITNGWIKEAKTLGKYLEEAESSTLVMNGNAQLIVGKPNGNETAWFTCGCCGNSFHGNVTAQLAFDQDAGYGICPDCQRWS